MGVGGGGVGGGGGILENLERNPLRAKSKSAANSAQEVMLGQIQEFPRGGGGGWYLVVAQEPQTINATCTFEIIMRYLSRLFLFSVIKLCS